jgi:riboflavin kinase / FMN adenylyltransferase
MQVHKNPDSLPHFHHAVLTIGTFDGVHTGHQQVIEQLKKEALQINGETVIITFDPHPRKIVGSSAGIQLINTPDEKIELLQARGIHQLVVVPFTEAFSQQTPQQYVRDFLVEKFHPHTIIIGYDHRFGKGRLGDFHLMEEMSAKYGYVLKEIPVHVQHAISVSSTRIRQAIAAGDMYTANDLLGYDFFFQARVIEGNKLGRTIGYPTANLKVDHEEKITPGHGVYAVEVTMRASDSTSRYKGMMNIGTRPTIGGVDQVIEVHIFDFDQDLYGRTIRVTVKKFLRQEQKFSGLEALKEQLAMDKTRALEIIG